MGTELEGFGEEVRRVDVGVAVDLAVAQEGGVFEAGNEAEDARLFAELEVILEADQIVGVRAEVLLAELDDGVGPAAGSWVGEARRASWGRSGECRGLGGPSLRWGGSPRSSGQERRRQGVSWRPKCGGPSTPSSTPLRSLRGRSG